MLPSLGHDDALIGVDAGDHRLSDEPYPALLVPGEVAYHDFLLHEDALQKTRQGDTIVERIGFVREQMNAARSILLAQGFGSGRPCDPVADNHIAFVMSCQTRTSFSSLIAALKRSLPPAAFCESGGSIHPQAVSTCTTMAAPESPAAKPTKRP